jgi:hypothetical protein
MAALRSPLLPFLALLLAAALVTPLSARASIPDPTAGGWQLNGDAAIVNTGSSDVLQLTDAATQYQVGSAFWPATLPSSSLHIAFDLFMGGGTGADGVALVFGDPANGATEFSLGGAGAGLGLRGIPGWGIGFETVPSSLVGVGQGGNEVENFMSYQTQTGVADLREATHHVDVRVALGHLTVTLDGTQVLVTSLALPPNVLVGFSGANGGLTDQHTISNVSILTPALLTAATSLTFGNVTVGQTSMQSWVVTNAGGEDATITGVTSPVAPFSATGLPGLGATIAPGATLTAQVSFTPTVSGSQLGSVGLSSDGGDVSAQLSGTGTDPGFLSITPAALAFGTVGSDGSVGRKFTVTNTGGSPLTITQSQPPALGQFFAVTPLPSGLTLAPGASRAVYVRLTPSAVGALSDGWVVNGDGLGGPQTVSLTGTGGSPANAPISDPGLGAWQLNGSATIVPPPAAPTLQLSDALTPYEAGSAYWPIPIAPTSLSVTFDLFMGGGSGADGLALVLADPSSGATVYSLGGEGAGLGVRGVPSWAVGFENYPSSFVGIGQGGAQVENFMSYSFQAPLSDLRNASHHVVVQTSNGTLSVSLDGVPVLSGQVALPSQVLLGFSGANGGLTDQQLVSNVSVSTSGTLAVGDRPEAQSLSLRVGPPGSASPLRVALSLASAEPATLEVFDTSGRRLVSREVGRLGPGPHLVDLDADRALSSGCYFVRLRQSSREITRKALILK